MITLPYGVYVIVIVLVAAAQTTEHPKFSVTNLNGSMVLPLIISGTTFGFAGSMATALSLTYPILPPTATSTECSPRNMSTVLADGLQTTLPPSDSIRARRGTRVRELRMIGAASSGTAFTSTCIVVL